MPKSAPCAGQRTDFATTTKQEDMQMENVFQQLYKIESTASSILDKANAKKKQMAADQEERIRRLNEEMARKTEDSIRQQKELLGHQIQAQLDEERRSNEELIAKLDREYEASHTQLAASLLAQLIKE